MCHVCDVTSVDVLSGIIGKKKNFFRKKLLKDFFFYFIVIVKVIFLLSVWLCTNR